MSFTEQLADFNAFTARLLSSRDGADDLSLEEVYDRWWEERHRDEDLQAIQQSAADYERGERGEDARSELADHRAIRNAKPTP